MKVKLLKKVRKRFSIIRVDKAQREGTFLKEIYDEIGKPFYFIEDKDDRWSNTPYSADYDVVYLFLVKRIRKTYQHTQKIKELYKQTKVWYND